MGEERREQILAAFENCVVRNGIEKTTLEDIAPHTAGTLLQIPNTLIFQRMVRRWKPGQEVKPTVPASTAPDADNTPPA